MIVADMNQSLELTGNGDVLEPEPMKGGDLLGWCMHECIYLLDNSALKTHIYVCMYAVLIDYFLFFGYF